MKITVTSVIVMTFMLAGCSSRPSADSALVKDELAKLQGVWQAESAVFGGTKETDPLIVSRCMVEIVDDVYYQYTFGIPVACKITIDPTQTEKTIDIEPDARAQEILKTKKRLGIYSVKDDIFTLCYDTNEKNRPKSLISNERSFNLITFRRVPGTVSVFSRKTDEKLVREEKARLAGTWIVTKLEIDGEDVSHRAIEDHTQLTFTEDTVTLEETLASTSKKSTDEFTYSIDPSTTPKAIDLKREHVIQHGIYEIEGDILRLCHSVLRGQGRPEQFNSSARYIFYTLKREAKATASKPQ